MVKTLLGLVLTLSMQSDPFYTINGLIENSDALNHQNIVIEAEVIGEVLERGENAWINVNDGTNAIGVYLKLEQTTQLKVFGDYFNVGDKIRINGVFKRAWIEHGGEMAIHATSIKVTKPGYPIEHPIPSWKLIASAIFMISALFGLYLKRDLFKKEKFKIEHH